MKELSRDELDALFSAAYDELRRLASMVKRGDASPTLNPTALVNEAYVKLVASLRLQPASLLHLKRLAARAMRQVLVEASRRRKALKRGGEPVMVTFDEGRDGNDACADEILALDTALQDLARASPRQALLVECRFFGGFDVGETAELLEVSESTVDRDWRAAKAWLALQIQGN